MFCGLSPLARGTHGLYKGFYVVARFIPAGAGNTFMMAVPRLISAVYPRWRGEHVVAGNYARGNNGLSPLARGTLSGALAGKAGGRFIPAGAGNTARRRTGSDGVPVYPRWRGEHPDTYQNGEDVNGLSPLARGTPTINKCIPGCGRFIPAGAGNTWLTKEWSNNQPVYPRWRGEHTVMGQHWEATAGLSPLARG